MAIPWCDNRFRTERKHIAPEEHRKAKTVPETPDSKRPILRKASWSILQLRRNLPKDRWIGRKEERRVCAARWNARQVC